MVSTRRSGSLSSSNNNNSSNSNSSTSSSNNNNSSNNGKRPSSSSAEEGTASSPKRLKVENGGAAEKSAVITNENCAPAADDSVDCAAVNPPAVVDGGGEAVNSVKPDSAASPLAPVSSPNPEGVTPVVMEQTKGPFSPVRNHPMLSLGFETLNKPWCRLLTQHSQNPNIKISGPCYTIGASKSCDFVLKDQAVSATLCRIKYDQRAVLECTGSKGTVLVNGMAVKKNTIHTLHSGDEVVFGISGDHAYIFEQLVIDFTLKAPLSVGNTEVQSVVGKYLPAEKRPGDPSAVAGASILASLSNLRPDISRWRTSSLSTSKTHQDSELSTHAVIQDGSEIEIGGMEGNSTPNIECDNAFDLGVTSKSLLGECDPEYGFEVSEQRNERTRSSQPVSTSGTSLRCAAFKEDICAGILDGNAVDVSFDDFPYYLRSGSSTFMAWAD